MADSETTPDVVAQQIRFALYNLAARNGHHLFEELCRHFAEARISRNILPATGPVSAGGDQGRDFETFRSFVAVEGDRRLAFACTLEQYKRLARKVKSDLAAIVDGSPVDAVYVFCEANLPKGRREPLISWARAEHGVELVVFDGNALAGQLAKPDVYWIAERYLALPSQAVLRGLAERGDPPRIHRSTRKLIGRDDALSRGMQHLCPDGDVRPVVVVTGPPGVGKTALAFALARCTELHYPDGQYLLDVPVIGEGGQEIDLLELLSTLLDGGISRPAETPRQRLARLRSFFAARKALVVVDNVQSESALRELLTIEGGLAVVCTSRSRLTGLAVDDAQFIEVEPLDSDDAARLATLTADRLTDEEARDLAQVCGGLPLAVLIAAAQIKGRPKLSVRDYLKQLGDPDRGLESLSAGQRSMQAIIEDSYCALEPEQASLMRVLGLLPNTTVTLDVIAAAATADCMNDLTDGVVELTTRLLDSLFELNLVEQTERVGYRLHDVLYRFARRKAADEAKAWQDQVIGNGCLMYAARAEEAVSSIGFIDEEASVPADTNPTAIKMLEHDRVGAVAMVESACRARLWDPAVTLAGRMIPALRHRGHWIDVQRVCQGLLLAGEQADNCEWRAMALHNLGQVEAHRGNSEEAIELYRRSSDLAEEAGEHYLSQIAYASYGNLLLDLGHINEGIAVLRQTLRVWRLIGDDASLAQALGNLGAAYLASGSLREAEKYLRNGIAVARRGKFAGLLPTMSTKLATVLRLMGRIEGAREECQSALQRARAVGDREAEAAALVEIGLFTGQAVTFSETGNPLENALSIYREIGDMKGQVTALRTLGVNAKYTGNLEKADQWLCECANLAAQIGDAHQEALATAHLAKMRGDIGRHEEADELFQQARHIAEGTGNEFLVSEVNDQQAFLLRATGRTEKAIPLLEKTVRILEKNGESTNLASARAMLGEALTHANRWQEAAQTLRLVSEAPPNAVHPTIRASAFRYLGVLYSRRDLHGEAEHAGRRAQALAQEGGSPTEQMNCHVTLGNILARTGRWQEAAEEYELAVPTATQLRDLHVMLTIRSNQATCSFKIGDRDKAVTQTRRAIAAAASLGLVDMEASLRVNLGAALADDGDTAGAITEFSESRDAAEAIGNANLAGHAAMNLAKAHRDQADLESATAAALYARTQFQAHGDWRSAAEALRIELISKCQDNDVADAARALVKLSATPPGIPREVMSAFWARDTERTDGTVSVDSGVRTGRRIHVADEVREALDGIDVDGYCAGLTNTRRFCFVCNLPIAIAGQAELLLLRWPGDEQSAMTLAHTACAPSSVMRLNRRPIETDAETFEIECAMLGDDLPGIVVDCFGGEGIDEKGKRIDTILATLKKLGFISVDKTFASLESGDGRSRIPRLAADTLSARLVGGRLTILAGRTPFLADAPLSFLPKWHRAAQHGVLVAMFGRNLQGMTWEDPAFIIKAAQTGRLVAAAMHLTTTPPGRNSLCVCTPRTGLKYKRCCGGPPKSEC